MATIKKGILGKAGEWWKHLKPRLKRKFWHRERILEKKFIRKEVES